MSTTADLPREIIARPDQVAGCCEHLAGAPQIGFDTEFVGELTYHPRLCLIQVATAERLFLIDPISAGPLDQFWKILNDPRHLIIVHAGKQEVRLCRMWSGQAPGKIFDLQLAAGLVGLNHPLGHGALVSQILGLQITKGETLTDWGIRPLTARQITYAFEDVKYLLALWQVLASRLEKLGRTAWADEEFEGMLREPAPEETGRDKWLKLRGVGSLDRHALAVVKAVYGWREHEAEDMNRPPRAILRDDLIVEVARRMPSRDRDLAVVRGIAKRYLSALIEVVDSCRKLPLQQCPPLVEREQDPPQVALLTSVLSAVMGNYCRHHGLAVGLVANQEDLRVLVRARLAGKNLPESSPLASGWRQAHLLPELKAVLDGRRRLRIADPAAEAPLEVVDDEPGPAK